MQIKTANGKQSLTITKSEWQAIGKKAGWNPFAKKPQPVTPQAIPQQSQPPIVYPVNPIG